MPVLPSRSRYRYCSAVSKDILVLSMGPVTESVGSVVTVQKPSVSGYRQDMQREWKLASVPVVLTDATICHPFRQCTNPVGYGLERAPAATARSWSPEFQTAAGNS